MEQRMFFHDRDDAGRQLATAVAKLGLRDVIVLAIPRGGVVVAKQVADALGAPLDLVVARKIGAPGNPEYAIGAVAQDGEPVIDDLAVNAAARGAEYIRVESGRQAEEVRRRLRQYRGDRQYPELEGKTVVVVDDGIATGSTVKAAIRSLRKRRPRLLVLAVPVAPPETLQALSPEVDEIVCLAAPEAFSAVGEFYEDFRQVEDSEVEEILRRHWSGAGVTGDPDRFFCP
jgi:putative phosphoribosyl transferase